MTKMSVARRASPRRNRAAQSITLRKVGDTLRKMRAATLTQLAADLAAHPREVEAMLAFWEHRGNVRRCQTPAALGCGTACRACPVGAGGSRSGSGRRMGTGIRVRALSRRGATTRVRHAPVPVVYEWVGR